MLKISGTQQEIDHFLSANDIADISNVEIETIEIGHITDEEINAFGKFTDHQKEIIKEAYARHEKGFFPNPMCALY